MKTVDQAYKELKEAEAAAAAAKTDQEYKAACEVYHQKVKEFNEIKGANK